MATRLKYILDSSVLSASSGGGASARLRFYKVSTVGVANARIYKVGDIPPAYTAMTDGGNLWDFGISHIHSPGLYNYQYKDDARELILGQLQLFETADHCQAYMTFLSTDSFVEVIVHISGFTYASDPHIIKISIDGGITYKSITQDSGSNSGQVFFYNNEMTTMGLDGNSIPSVKINRVRDCGIFDLGQNFYLSEPSYTPMMVDYTVSGVTSNGGNDGAITLTVTGGSGNRTYVWEDGPTTQNRSGLIQDTYHVTVTDVITNEVADLYIPVTEPAPPVTKGSFLEVPKMNSITFVVQEDINDCDNPQGLDNVLLCEQVFEGFLQTNYFQKFNKCDSPITQFNSDYSLFEITMHNYDTDQQVKAFLFELKEQNIGITEDFNITIRAHSEAGKSRVYFVAGALPIPLSVGDNFQILNNVNGYNGGYTIIDIINDPALGYQYLVITKAFIGPGTYETGTGRFLADTANFNVFESLHEFLDVDEGQYYIKIRAFDVGNPDEKIAISEPLDIRNTQPGTTLLKYRNIDNAFDITWTTGYQGLLRVDSHFGHRRSPGGERSTNRNSDYKLVKVSAKKTRVMLFQTWSLPPYMHEKLSTLFDCDNYSVNNVECQSNEGYNEPEYKDMFLLANSSIKLEARWYDKYNSDDLGSVGDGGFILVETGFLKR